MEKPSKSPELQKVSLKKLFSRCTLLDYVLLCCASIVSIITGAGLPLLSILQGNVGQSFINEEIYLKNNNTVPNDPSFTENTFRNKMFSIIWQYAGLTLAQFCAAYIQVTFFMIVCERINTQLKKDFFKAILRQDITYFDTHQSGTLATTLFDNLERVKEGTGDKMGIMIQYISQFITGFTIALAHDWKLTLVMLAFTPIQAVCGFFVSRAMSTLTQREGIKYSKAGVVAEEVISSIRTVVSFNGLEKECTRYADALVEATKVGILKSINIACAFAMIQFINFVCFAVAFYIGVGWVHNGSLTPGTLLTVFFSVLMGSMALGQAGPQIAVVGIAQGAAAPIFEVIDREPEIDSKNNDGVELQKVDGRILLKNVSFSYPSRPDVKVIKNLSLTVESGQTIALVGSSGSGKSSIVNLLLRYYNPSEGSILIDDTPIQEFKLEFLRQKIAVVSQEPILFNCSIEDNIKYGREDITQFELAAACKAANAEGFIKKLPQKYATIVGERGTQLSGGQKQRIAIARALVRDPRILLLDEATSALDAESEALVQAALEKASEGRTTIIIAHRLSTIRNADKIIAMKNGEVLETGTHDELMEKKGAYYELVQAQTFTDAVDNVKGKMEALQHQTSVDRPAYVSKHRSSTIASMSGEILLPDIIEEEEPRKKDALTRLKHELQEEGAKQTNLLEILRFASSELKWLAIGLSAVIVGGLIFPAYSVIFTELLNIFTLPPAELLSKGHTWSLFFLILAVAQGVAVLVDVFFFGYGAELMTKRLRSSLFRNVLSQEIAYFDSPRHATGKICTRLATDVPNLRNSMDFRLATVGGTIISCIAGISIAFYFGWRMALVAIGLYPLLGVGQAMRTYIMQGKHRQTTNSVENSGKIAMEAIENVKTVQALTREDAFYRLFCSHLDGPHKDAIRQAIVQGLVYGFAMCSMFLLNCLQYRLGLYLILNRYMTPMHVLRVIYAISISTATVGFSSAYFPEYLKAKFAGGIIFSMLKERSSIDNLSKDGKRPKIDGSVEFCNVHFAYPERKNLKILKGLSLKVNTGETLALVGPSGGGKSTVVALLERFYDTDSGSVKVDNVDIKEINPDYLRSHMAIVSQEPILFDCSIKENIAYGVVNASDNDVIDAAKKANIHNFIISLPNGYDTRVGDKGTQLSGGQKQRVAIARALIRNPKILLLDEATSALDTESEKIVHEALDRARSGRTCIVIAHRLSTIISADRIAVIEGGCVVETGTHSELLENRGTYYELTKRQNLA